MNKKIKIFVSIIVLIGVITIAGFTLKINSANKGIKIEDPGTLYIGGITDLIISPEEGSSITEEEIEQKYKDNEWQWTSSNEDVIQIQNPEEEEAITAVGAGTSTIRVVDSAGNYAGERTITIPEPKVSFEEEKSSVYDSKYGFLVKQGGKQALTLKIENLGLEPIIEWVVSDRTILKVMDNDSIEALKPGVATVKAVLHTAYGDFETKEIKFTVPGIKINKTTATIKKGETLDISATVIPDDAQITWTSKDKNILAVENEKFVAKKAGTTKVVAKMTLNLNGITYEDEAECQVTVEEDTQDTPDETEHIKLSSTSERLSVGATLTLSAITDPEQDVVWTSSDEKIAKLVEPGCVYGVAEGTATITATTADGKYSASCKVTVVGQDSNQDNNDNNNNNNNNNNNPNDNKNNTSINGKIDNSLSNNKLPYTGFASFLKVAMVIVILVGSSMYILYRRYNGIK